MGLRRRPSWALLLADLYQIYHAIALDLDCKETYVVDEGKKAISDMGNISV